jgi:hypothetical protein
MFGIGMFDETKIPELDSKTYDKILSFAKKRNLEICASRVPEQCPYYCVHDKTNTLSFQLAEHSLQIIKKKEVEVKKFLRTAIKTNLTTEICVGNHFFTAANPEIFEDFGREVYGLKTDSEKQASK